MMPISFRVGRKNTITPKTGQKKAGYSLSLSWSFRKRNLLAGRKNKGGRKMFTTGDKLLNVMKEEEISIMELSRMSGVPERTIMDILAGIREPELGVVCRIADGLGICVHELRADEEQYAISVQKDTLAKLIVVSEINGVELEELIHTILEKGIEEHGFYE